MAAKDDVAKNAADAKVSKDSATASAASAAANATIAKNSATSAKADSDGVKTYVAMAKRKFTIYVFERTVSVGQRALAITPQYMLTSQNPPLDWYGTASATSNGTLVANIINNGAPMETAATIRVVNGVVSFTVTPHSIQNGDTLVITLTTGMISELSLTLRYDSENF